jgi:hypothetical protein
MTSQRRRAKAKDGKGSGSVKQLKGMFYDPKRKPASIEEMNEAVMRAVSRQTFALELKRPNGRGRGITRTIPQPLEYPSSSGNPADSPQTRARIASSGYDYPAAPAARDHSATGLVCQTLASR